VNTITAILVNYNYSRFLPESLGSILAQTRPADELIIIDDASTDDSAAVSLNLISKAPNAKLVRNAENIGCVPTMCKGLAMAMGDIVFFAASDDVFYPRLFEGGVSLLDAHPEAALFSASSDIIDAVGTSKGRFPSPKPLSAPGYLDPSEALRQMLRDDGWFMGNTVLYRRSALLAEEGFDERLGGFADGYMCRSLALKHGACFTPEVLAAWRRLEGGIAWSQAADADQVPAFVAFAAARMAAAGGLFPAQYIHRWQRRYVFGARRFALARRNTGQPGILGGVKRALDALRVAWMFLMLRPWDIGTVLRRRIREFWERRRYAHGSASSQ
jgi:glycosyltransferase involved in cell wall biosynthesis